MQKQKDGGTIRDLKTNPFLWNHGASHRLVILKRKRFRESRKRRGCEASTGENTGEETDPSRGDQEEN